LQEYECSVPKSYREVHKQTCVAAIVACFQSEITKNEEGDDISKDNPENNTLDFLQVMGLGVGTKFLSATTLQEQNICTRIRDCHAEVLARRAFRRQLLHEIENDLQGKSYEAGKYVPILERIKDDNQPEQNEAKKLKMNRLPKYGLRPGVTLHFYASSAPCGNATLKKFVKMEKELFDSELVRWPLLLHWL
jgi:hypothetical protein